MLPRTKLRRIVAREEDVVELGMLDSLANTPVEDDSRARPLLRQNPRRGWLFRHELPVGGDKIHIADDQVARNVLAASDNAGRFCLFDADTRHGSIEFEDDAELLRQRDEAVGNGNHSALGNERTHVVFQMRDNRQNPRRSIRAGTIIGGHSIEVLDEPWLAQSAQIRLVQRGAEIELSSVEQGSCHTLGRPRVPPVQGFLEEDATHEMIDALGMREVTTHPLNWHAEDSFGFGSEPRRIGIGAQKGAIWVEVMATDLLALIGESPRGFLAGGSK